MFRDAWPVVAAALALTACKKDGGVLVDVVAVEPGAECAAGGTRIDTGVDEDRDGALSDDEITSSDVICAGEAPPPQSGVATRTTDLPYGDADCPYGGTRLEAGLDDGAGGGTAGDGVLQDGEVDTTSVVCDDEPLFAPRSVEPPAGPAGAFTITAPGGEGTHASGGEGGFVWAIANYGTMGGGVRVFDTGIATSDVAFPATAAIELGPNPVEVTASTTPLLDPTVGDLADGTLYVVTGVWELRIRDAAETSGYRTASGLRVANGATLTLPDNSADDTRALLQFSHDVHLAGTITTVRAGGAPASLSMTLGSFHGEATGRVDLSGTDATGASGGRFELDATYGWNYGAIFNRATIDVSGGDGTSGGEAGQVDWYASVRIYNAGAVVAHGGAGTAGAGGRGANSVTWEAFLGVYNEGAIDVHGGDGTQGGGDAGTFSIEVGTGFLVDKGAVDASGGDATACTTACSGGPGGSRLLTAYGGSVVVSGSFTAPGGDAPKLSGNPDTTTGGSGGYLSVELSLGDSGWYADYTQLGDIAVSGNIDLSGGDGATGGDGGWVDLSGDYADVPDDQQVMLLGYTSLDLSGGDGATGGGNGGLLELSTEYADAEFGSSYGPGGAVANHVDVDLTGGDGATTGGRGGYVRFTTDGYYGQYGWWEIALNRGDIDASGGAGGVVGGGGDIHVFGSAGVENSGALTADAGSGNANSEERGGGSIELYAEEGPAEVGGTLSVNGGSTTAGGGAQAGFVGVVGEGITATAAIDAGGGAGATAGGDGGLVVFQTLGGPSSVTGAIDILGGTGTAAGIPGTVTIDSQNVTSQYAP